MLIDSEGVLLTILQPVGNTDCACCISAGHATLSRAREWELSSPNFSGLKSSFVLSARRVFVARRWKNLGARGTISVHSNCWVAWSDFSAFD